MMPVEKEEEEELLTSPGLLPLPAVQTVEPKPRKRSWLVNLLWLCLVIVVVNLIIDGGLVPLPQGETHIE